MSPPIILFAMLADCIAGVFFLVKMFRAGTTGQSFIFLALTAASVAFLVYLVREFSGSQQKQPNAAPGVDPTNQGASFTNSPFRQDYAPQPGSDFRPTPPAPPPAPGAYIPVNAAQPSAYPPGYSAPPVAPAAPVAPVQPSGIGSGVAGALGGFALGSLVGSHLGTGAAAAIAADEVQRRERRDRDRRENETSGTGYTDSTLLAPIDGDALDQSTSAGIAGATLSGGVSGGLLSPVEADEIDRSGSGSGSGALPPVEADEIDQAGAGSGALPPVDSDHYEAAATSLDPISASDLDHSPQPEPEPEPSRSYSGSLAPISSEQAEQRGGYEEPAYEPPAYDPPTYDSPASDYSGGGSDD